MYKVVYSDKNIEQTKHYMGLWGIGRQQRLRDDVHLQLDAHCRPFHQVSVKDGILRGHLVSLPTLADERFISGKGNEQQLCYLSIS